VHHGWHIAAHRVRASPSIGPAICRGLWRVQARSISINQGGRQLEFLTDLARKSAGSISFATYTELGRGNFFSFIEVWKDSASYTAFQSATNTQKVLADLKAFEIAPLDERDGNLVE
jgi:quinol monooxygenase YgiN